MSTVTVEGSEFAELSAEILGRGNSVRFRARGRSMLPLIRNDDLLTVVPASFESLRWGDIALHRTGDGRLLAHRVVLRRINGGHVHLFTRGDALARPRDPVGPADVLGRVVARERNGKCVRLDRGWRRVAGAVWARFVPFRPLLLAIASRVIRLSQRCCPRSK